MYLEGPLVLSVPALQAVQEIREDPPDIAHTICLEAHIAQLDRSHGCHVLEDLVLPALNWCRFIIE